MICQNPAQTLIGPWLPFAYEESNTLFIGAMIEALANHLKDIYLHNKTGKDLCDALNNDYVVQMLVLNYISLSSTMTVRWLMKKTWSSMLKKYSAW
jgi:hypothetical protein